MSFSKKDAIQRLFLCPWMDGIPQGARKAVWLRPWIGPYIAKSQGWRGDERPWIGPYIAKSQGWRCDERPWMDGIPQKARKAAWLCAAFIAGITTSLPALADSACSSTQLHETASVKYVHDGDTLHLHDGRKVRLIGINTPEVAHGKHAAERYAVEAKNALQDLFKDNKTISLIAGEDKNDRYQRLLAHGFTEDGTNIQAALLAQGLAYAVTFPPNTKFTNCYLEQESIARCNKSGLWKKTKPLNAKKLNDTHIGFKLVKGKLKNININKKGIWLNIDNKLTIGIRPDNLPLFDIKALNELLNQTIIVRGWLNKSNKSTPYYLRIRHPQSLQLFSAFSCS